MPSKNYTNQFPQYYKSSAISNGNLGSLNDNSSDRYLLIQHGEPTTSGHIYTRKASYVYKYSMTATLSSVSIQCDIRSSSGSMKNPSARPIIECTMLFYGYDTSEPIWSQKVSYSFPKDTTETHRFSTEVAVADAQYICFEFSVDKYSSASMYVLNPSVDFTAAINDLTIPSISPSTLQLTGNPSNDVVRVSIGNVYSCKYDLTFKANGITKYSGQNLEGNSQDVTCYPSWFTGTTTSMEITVEVVDKSSGFTRSDTGSFTLLKLQPLEISSITPDPITLTNTANDYVSINLNNRNGENVLLKMLLGSTEVHSQTLSADTNNIVNLTASKFKSTSETLSVQAKVTGSTSGRQNTKNFSVKLPLLNLSRRPESGNIKVGETIEITVENHMGSYTYSLKSGATQLAAESESITTQSFSITCDSDWFTKAKETGKTLSVVCTVKDAIGREKTISFTAEAKIDNITISSISPSTLQLTGNPNNDKVFVSLGNVYSCKYDLTFKANGITKYSGQNLEGNSQYITCYPSWFTGTTTSMEIAVEVVDKSSGFTRSDTGSFTLLKLQPLEISSITPDPITLTNTENDYVRIDLGNRNGENVSLKMLLGSTEVHSQTLSADTNNIVNLTASKFKSTSETLSVQAKVTGSTSGRQSTKNFSVKLPLLNLSRRPESGNIKVGETIKITVENHMGSYTYSLKSGATQLAAESESITTQSFSITCDSDWFTKAKETGKTLSVVCTVKDAIGREKTISFTAEMPDFAVNPKSQSVTVESSIEIEFLGSAGQTVEYALSYNRNNESITFYTSSTTQESIEYFFPWNWFQKQGINDESSITITVFGKCGSRQDSKTFTLNYFTLYLMGNYKKEVFVGEDMTLELSGRNGESMTLDFYNNGNKLSLGTTYTFDSHTIIFQMPQLFNAANANTMRSLTIDIVISDNRKRQVTASGIKVKASSSMAPQITSFSVTPVNPDTLDEKFEGKFISQLSTIHASVTVVRQTNAVIRSVVFRYRNVNYQATSRGNNVYTWDSTVPAITEFQVGEDSSTWNFDVSVSATDERGMSVSSGVFPSIYLYRPPTAEITYRRCNVQDGVIYPSDYGEWCHLVVNYGFSGIWSNTFPPYALNEGTITSATTGYSNTQDSWLQGHTESQEVELTVGYGLDDNGEIVANSLRAATLNSISIEQSTSYTLEFDGDYYADYAIYVDGVRDKTGQISSGGTIVSFSSGDRQLFISLRRKVETSTPVDIAEANMHLSRQFSPSESGTAEFLIPNMDMEHSYNINIVLADLITSVTYTVRLSTAGVIMDFLSGGKGVALGKVAEYSGMVEVNPEWKFQAEQVYTRVKSSDGSTDLGIQNLSTFLYNLKKRLDDGGL